MQNIIEFLRIINNLKSVKRAGWVERGVRKPESVADHSFMMALMCMVLPAKGVDRDKTVKMALVHDLAESVTGDLITKENWEGGGSIASEDKAKLERKTLNKILASLEPGTAKEIAALWEEFEEGNTGEARFAKDIDMAEVMLQAYDYHKSKNFKMPLAGFWDDRNIGKIKDENIKMLVKKIIGLGQ